MKKIKVVAAIIQNKGEILIAKRSYGEFKGLFEFPGGKVEPGETGEVAIKREIKEELNVDIEVKSFFTNVQFDYPRFHLDMDCYMCSLNNYDFKLDSHSEIQWVNRFEHITKFCPADQLVIKKLVSEENIYGNTVL